jgi:hypothetical protein
MQRVAVPVGSCLLLLIACAAEVRPPHHRVLEPRADWSRDLARLLPGIRVCLADADGEAVGVTHAWPIGNGLTGVRLLRRDGARVDCIAGADGARVILTEPVRPASKRTGERDPLFTPVALDPPYSPCIESTKAVDAAGSAVGWLSYDVCRDPRPFENATRPQPSRPPASPQEG